MRARSFWVITTLILLVGFGFRVWDLEGTSLWGDEKLTELRVEGSLKHTYYNTLNTGNHMPLYFFALRLFPTGSNLLLRFPSVMAGMLGIALTIFLVRKLYQQPALALWAGALLACNPLHVWYSRMARPYALLYALAVLVSYCFLMLLRKPRSRPLWIVFTLASAAAYGTHYFGLMLAFAQYLAFMFLLRGRRTFFRRWVISQAIASIPVLLWLVALSTRETVTIGIGWIPTPGLDDVLITLWNLTLGYDSVIPWLLAPGLIAVAVGLTLGLYHALRERARQPANLYWFWLLVGPLAVVFVLSRYQPIYIDRYLIEIMPAALLLMLVGWQRLPRKRWLLAGLVVASGALNMLFIFAAGDHEKESWDEAAAFVARHALPGDTFLIEHTSVLDQFAQYYGVAELKEAGVFGVTPADKHPQPLLTPGGPVRRVWALYRTNTIDAHRALVLAHSDPFAPGSSPLADWLVPRQDRVILQQRFNGITLLLVETEGNQLLLIEEEVE